MRCNQKRRVWLDADPTWSGTLQEPARKNAGVTSMKEPRSSSEETKLRELLHHARPTAELPPRFQENVWRRIEQAESSGAATAADNWLNVVAGWLVRPRLAFAVATMLVLVGVGFGLNNGAQQARAEAQARYIAVVAPNALH